MSTTESERGVAWVPRPSSLPAADVARLVVEASAGTGKTFFIEHRVADLMIGAGAGLEQILLVTFTEKATAELRGRIRGLLDRLVHAVPGPLPVDADETAWWRIDDPTRARLRAALWSFERATISTIHGFCQRVLLDEALVGRRLFDQTQIAEDVAFEEAWRALLREQFARDPDDAALLAAYLGTGGKLADLHKLLASTLRHDAELTPALHPTLPLAEAARVRDLVCAITQAEAFVMSADGPANRATKATRIVERVRLRMRAATTTTDAALALAAMADDDDSPLSLIESLRPNKGKFAAPEVEALRAALTELQPRLQPLPLIIAHRFAPPLRARLERDKTARGQFDYQDLLARLAAILTEPGGDEVAARLRARLPWALIDEFQDTDPLQWAIFEKVWLHPAARGLAIVGDPKQAIYGFRGADVATYLRARQAMLDGGATRIDLDVNQRSTAALVGATNALIVGPAPANGYFTGNAIGYDAPVRPSGRVTATPASPAIVVWDLAALIDVTAEARREAHLEAIAREVGALTTGDAPLRLGDGDAARRLTAADVLVLTRTNKESRQVADGLRRRGVPCALLMAEYLLGTDEATAVADLLDALANPRDGAARLRAWRTPFFDVPWADLRAALDAPDHHPLVAPLLAWAELARRREWARLFHAMLTGSDLATRALAALGGERAIVNIRHVLELLQVELDRSACDLGELLRRLRTWIAAAEEGRLDDTDVQRAETDEPAVRILTIHRAKGLEAPVVFLFGGTSAAPRRDPVVSIDNPRGGRRSTLRTALDTDDDLKRAHARAVTDEDERLGYVALTRAKLRMYLPVFPKLLANAAYHPVQCALEHWDRVRALPPDVVRMPLPAPPPDAAIDVVAVIARAVLPPLPPVVPLPVPRPSQVGGELLSYSRLSADEDGAARGRSALDQPDEARVEIGPDELPPGAAGGLCVHEVLERVDLASLRDAGADADAWAARPDVAAVLTAAMARNQVPARARAHLARLAFATLTRVPNLGPTWTDAPLPPLLATSALLRELEFTFPLPASTGAAPTSFVRGVFDAVAVWDDALWIVDYKSDVLPRADHATSARLVDERYRIQATLYGLAGARLAARPRPQPLRLAGLLYWFVRDHIVVPLPATAAQQRSWQAWLATRGTP